MNNSQLSIVILNWNTKELTLDCLRSIKESQKTPPEIILVDNASSDDSVPVIKKAFPTVKLIQLDQNRGFGGGNNPGIKAATGSVCFILNNDTILTHDLSPALEAFNDPKVGAVAPLLRNADGSIQGSIRSYYPSAISALRDNPIAQRLFGPPKNAGYPPGAEIPWATGAALFVRASLLKELGGFDERFFMYFEETDLCKRIQEADYSIIYRPEVELVHLGGGSVEAKDKVSMAPVYYYDSLLKYLHKHRIRGRVFVRIALLLSSLALWITMSLKGRSQRALRYKSITTLCLKPSN